MRGGRGAEFAVLLILLCGVWLGFSTAGLPRVMHEHEPPSPGAFSVELAMQELRTIAATPHPTGTAAHDRLRDYLVDRLRALGLTEVHVQSATGFNTLDGPIAATVANVVARRRGTRPGRALLLMAHYDAVPRSFGAGDDGAGVAAILETLRALANSPPLDRDLIVVFSDAEEDGLLGAEAFVNLHPWAKDVDMVLNFEGRGNAGPVYMFQTSPGNAALIKALAASVADARTNSLTGEVYRHLPSDTDLSIWLHSAFPVGALNFAHVGGYTHYHTPIDNVASLDPRVLQQMGDYALGLTRVLGSSAPAGSRTHDAIYFNAPVVGVVHYPASWAVPLSVLAIVGVMIVVGLAVRRGMLSAPGIGRGFVLLLLTLALPAAVTFFAWRLIQRLHPAYEEILQHDPYNSLWYLLAFAALTAAAVFEAQRWFNGRATGLELAVAPLATWSLLGLAIALVLPGASYLLLWPLLAVTFGAGVVVLSTEKPPSGAQLAVALLALPALVLWPPLIKSLEVALTANQLAFCVLLAALVLALLVLPLSLAGHARRWGAIGATAVAVAALIGAEVAAGFNTERKRPDSLAFLLDADSGRASWVSFDRGPDAWTTKTLGLHPAHRPFDEFYLTGPGDSLLAADAGSVIKPPSPIHVVSNDSVAGGRRLHLRIARSGPGEMLWLYVDSAAAIHDMSINDRALRDGAGDRYAPRYHLGRYGMVLRYFGVPEDGIDLRFTIPPGPATLHVVTAVEGLPDTQRGPVPPRPADVMSKPSVPTDMTIVKWTIRTDGGT